MVWVTDLDAPEDQCKAFVDAAVERVSCDFLLPTLCEMDEHVNLTVDFLKSEFVYAIVAAVVGILLIAVVIFYHRFIRSFGEFHLCSFVSLHLIFLPFLNKFCKNPRTHVEG